MDALREAAKKVTAAKNQGSGGTDSSTFINGGSQDSRAAEGPQTPIHQSVVSFSTLATDRNQSLLASR
ncbi:hypothetical protein CUMW_095040 [Citrus unshiu]|uniref:Uncharacterized protein n=1 Tax=Citrus unshiu TaxID=55188 RepID=A0A2H5P1E9_CITUN|nr:hypothetical protein CUMW_095040 [Citrus unshiu]